MKVITANIDDDKLYGISEAAELLQVSTSTVRNWLDGGHFPNAGRGGPSKTSRWKVPGSDLRAFVETWEQASSEEMLQEPLEYQS